MVTLFTALADTVKVVSPVLGTALVGPLGGAVTSLLAGVFGGSSSNPEELIEKIANDPESYVKIKQVEAQLEQIKADRERKSLEDVEHAREHKGNSMMVGVMSLSIVWGFLVILGVIMFLPQEASDIDIIKIMIGYFAGCLTMVVRHWFGGV